MTAEDFLDSVCDALGREPGSLTRNDSPESVEEWDSLGHLAIIDVIDEKLGIDVGAEDMLDFQSIGQLLERLKSLNAFGD